MAVTYSVVTSGTGLTDTTVYTTASVTYDSTLAYLLVVGSADDDVSDIPVPTTANVTWNQLTTVQTDSGVRRRLTVFDTGAHGDTPQTTTLTFATTQYNVQWHIIEVANADAENAAIEAASGFGNAFGDVGPTLTGVAVDNSTFMACIINNTTSTLSAVAPGTALGNTTTGGDPTGGGRMITTYSDTPDTTPQVTISGTTNRRWCAIGVEIALVAGALTIDAPTIAAGTTVYAPSSVVNTGIAAPAIAATTNVREPIVSGTGGPAAAATLALSNFSNTDVGPYTTASMAFSASRSYLLVAGARSSDLTSIPVPIITTTGVTWTLKDGAETSGGTALGRITLFEGVVTSPGTRTTLIDYGSQATTILNAQWHIIELGQASLTAPVVQTAATQGNSFGEVGPTLAAFWNFPSYESGYASSTNTNGTFVALLLNNATSVLSAGTGFTELGNTSTATDVPNTSLGRMESAFRTTNDTTPTVTISGTTLRRWAAVGAEIAYTALDLAIVGPAWSTSTTVRTPTSLAAVSGGAYQGYSPGGGYGSSLAGTNSITAPKLTVSTNVRTPGISNGITVAAAIAATTVVHQPSQVVISSNVQSINGPVWSTSTTVYTPVTFDPSALIVVPIADVFPQVHEPSFEGGRHDQGLHKGHHWSRYMDEEFLGLR